MAEARLFYDATCPICSNYVRMLRKKISPNKISFIPTQTKAAEFQFVTPDNQVFTGKKAVEQLGALFPEVLSYFWMLPDKYKMAGLQTAYKVGSVIRKAKNKLTVQRKRGCGCKG